MHANTRKNLRTVLTGMTRNLSSVSAADASVYLEYMGAHSRLLNLVTKAVPDDKSYDYEAKASALSQHFVKCGGSLTAENTSGYFSDLSLSPVREDRSELSKLQSENTGLLLEVSVLEDSKAELQKALSGYRERAKSNEVELNRVLKELDRSEQALQLAERKQERTEKDLVKMRKTVEELEEASEKLKKQVIKLEKEKQQLIAEEMELEEASEKLKKQVIKLEKEKQQLIAEKLEVIDDRVKIHEEMRKLRSTAEAAKEELKAMRSTAEAAKEEVKVMRSATAAAKENVRAMKSAATAKATRSAVATAAVEKESDKENLEGAKRKTVRELLEIFEAGSAIAGANSVVATKPKLAVKN